jgi:hypothetical protein
LELHVVKPDVRRVLGPDVVSAFVTVGVSVLHPCVGSGG